MTRIERDVGYTRKFCFSFRAGKDADVIGTLDAAPNMVEFVRQAIRDKVVKDSGWILPPGATVVGARIVAVDGEGKEAE